MYSYVADFTYSKKNPFRRIREKGKSVQYQQLSQDEQASVLKQTLSDFIKVQTDFIDEDIFLE